jgi:hypothetical protein
MKGWRRCLKVSLQISAAGVDWGYDGPRQSRADWEQGTPSAPAEFVKISFFIVESSSNHQNISDEVLLC